MPEPLKIDVWSDIACPWCYIGKRRLEAGIAAYSASEGALPIEVEYHSFELMPDTPVDFDGNEVEFLVRHKRLTEDKVRAMIDRVTGVAAGEGLAYDFDALRHTNTVKAHQLLHAKERGRQVETKERLLRGYFVEGRHIGRDEDLADLAAELGFDRDDVLRSLAGDEYLPAVRADQRAAAELGIQAVPFYVIDGRFGLSGAHPADAFSQALAQATGERAELRS